jgi:protein involved in polysaccharide export with SLBB domain
MNVFGNAKHRSFVVICALLGAGAAASAAPDSIKVAVAVPASPIQPIVRDESYRLTAKDLLKITVFHEDDLATITRIGKDGTISFPLIRSAKVGGRTVREATQILQTQLMEYLVQPEVSISIVEYAKRHITILGQVGRPGTIDMPDDATLNLVEAIGLAGGFTRIANPSKIILKRQVNGQETIFKLDANKMMRDSSTVRFEVLPGDTIVVGESIF